MLKTIGGNLLGYDLIIVLVALVNAFVIFPRAKKSSKALAEHLQPKIFVPITLLMNQIKGNHEKKLDLNALKAMRSSELYFYNIFGAINNAFPMLGMLGTILALLSMINLSDEMIALQFTSALTSTFWGLVFALIFKAIDAPLSTEVEENGENLKLIFDRIDALEASHETQ